MNRSGRMRIDRSTADDSSEAAHRLSMKHSVHAKARRREALGGRRLVPWLGLSALLQLPRFSSSPPFDAACGVAQDELRRSRRRGSSPVEEQDERSWIPAYAGMTVEGCGSLRRKASRLPAFA
jgi:hypothetical protein